MARGLGFEPRIPAFKAQWLKPLAYPPEIGWEGRSRTYTVLINSQGLYRLSYFPVL